MKNCNKQSARSDTTAPSKSKIRSKAYLKYMRYIKSKEFKLLREEIFKRDNYTCVTCGWNCDKDGNERKLTCHHITYEHLYDEKNHIEDLITLCDVCHNAIHRSIKNKKRFNKPKIDEP